MSAETYDDPADLLERTFHEICRRTWGHPPKARALRRACEKAGPEYRRMWDAGRRPLAEIKVTGSGYEIVLSDDGPRSGTKPYTSPSIENLGQVA